MAHVRSRTVVWGAALLAVVGRYCGLLWPLRPDEAGFLLVARAWDPQPDSLYHPYFVDRPPSLLLLFRWADAVGGPYFLRLVAALGCGLAVLLAASFVRELARSLPLRVAPAALWLVTAGTALMTAAFLITTQIDAISAKGEILGVPVVLGACVLALRALRTRSPWWAFAAGVLAMSATGLKQSLLGGLVFGGVLLVASWATHRLERRHFLVLGSAALAGAAVPVVATVGWTIGAGVELGQLEYAVLGFRGDASHVIVEHNTAANVNRTVELLLIFAATGMALVALWCLARISVAVRRLSAVTAAALAMLALDLAVIVASGSFWPPYLFALVPSLVVVWACVRVADLPSTEHGGRLALRASGRWHPRREVLLVAFCVVSAVLSSAVWTWEVWYHGAPPRQYVIGQAISRVAAPGDTLTVYGGRPDIQWASGMTSPYEQLWSLPMRTMDPELDQLRTLMEGPDAPTWLVQSASLGAWDGLGLRGGLGTVLTERYEDLGTICGYRVHRLADAPPVPQPTPDCRTPWGRR